MGIGGTVGSFLPMLWGSSDLLWPIVLSTVGGLLGIWAWYKLFRFA